MKIILIGPGGSGKSSLAKKISMELGIKRVVSTTSRLIRKDEINHVDYHFIAKEDFEKKIQVNFFIEFVKIYDNYYGIAYTDFTDDCIATMAIESAKCIKDVFNDVIIIYLKCPLDICKKRIMLRDDKSCEDSELNMRLSKDQTLFREIPYDCIIVDASKSADAVLSDVMRHINYQK